METNEKNCKICVSGRYNKCSGSVYCCKKKRMLLTNKAEDCEDYKDNYDIRSLKKRGKYEEEAKYVDNNFNN